MEDTYERDITENLGDNRNLILLGVRADADINYLNDIVAKQEKVIARLNKCLEEPSTTKQSD